VTKALGPSSDQFLLDLSISDIEPDPPRSSVRNVASFVATKFYSCSDAC
jgi:hypothetical protein